VNDRFGHLTGNKLLRAISESLSDSCREYDYVARMGGDEFVLILPGIHPDDVPTKIEALRRKIASVGSQTVGEDVVGASVGCAMYPAHATTADELLAHADKMMYSAKHAGKRSRRATIALAAAPVYAAVVQ
jgi:diguanylate cyclase (GGDEF)-like protein